ncbi:MAG TPA: glycoside hydrolase family 3 C-terminal domain-containing protein [Terriglobia bacterium]|nr:glycoside hydrolase family 3 C-terminal domain-containing protein [Terriglobia bacterium]
MFQQAERNIIIRLSSTSVILSTLLSFLILLSTGSSKPNVRPWMNSSLSADQRADLLLQQMTLDEKIQFAHGWSDYDTKYPGSLGGDAFVQGIPRLGFPNLQMVGAGVGVTDGGRRPNGQSTALPSALLETATWDLDAAHDFGTVIGKETRSEGFHVSLGGGLNLTREPRDGRNFEYHGEDPFLAGKMLGRELKAIQDQHLVSMTKHFAVNDQESFRDTLSSNLDKRSMRESDMLAFEIAIKYSDVGTICCAYNRVNGDYSCENSYLLNDVLKKAWGYKGWVMSDWGATHSTVKAAVAGLDQEMPTGEYFADPLKKAVQNGEVPMSRLNDMVHRILRTVFASGVIDDPPIITPIDAPGDAAVAQRVAELGSVLLKNSGNSLPLNASRIHSIAVIGSHADKGVLSGGGSSQVNPIGGNAVPPKPGSSHSDEIETVWDPSPPLRAIRAQAPNAKVQYDEGTDFGAAATLAKASDVAIVFATQWTTEGADVPTLALPNNQDELINRVAAANPRTIVVLETGGAVLMPWINQVNAVLESWYPGQRGGEAIANILFGDVNPSGKLPITFPMRDADLPHPKLIMPPPKQQPAPEAAPDINYTEGLKVGYKWYDAEDKDPLFPFGFGLSYTAFSYSQLKVTSGKTVQVSFTVKNSGARAGAEIAQVYLGLPTSAGEPPKRLVGWEKVQLGPGESRSVTVTVDPQMMAVFNPDKDAWEVVPGNYSVYVGGSSRALPLRAKLALAGSWP